MGRHVWALALLFGCASSSSSPTSACADISGNWKISSTRTDGDCDQAKFPDQSETVSFRRDGDGWAALFPGVSGGCAGTLNGSTCQFLSNCDFTDAQGRKVTSVAADWTFSGASFKGTSATRTMPPIVPTACSANYRDTGQKL